MKHLNLLSRFPYLGSVVPHRPGVRMLVHSPILIYYRVMPELEAVDIEVRHAARR